MKTVIFHIDVNSAFLSWEAVYRLREQGGTVDLREIASAVGGDKSKRRGIILAKSLSAKACGVRSRRASDRCLEEVSGTYGSSGPSRHVPPVFCQIYGDFKGVQPRCGTVQH